MVLLFLVLSVVMTWPLARHLERAISDPGDPFFSTWVLDWGYHATVTDAPLFDANILHPAKRSLAFSEHTYGITLLMLPLFGLGIAPLTIHNLAILLGFALSGYSAYLLARHATGSTPAAIVGGLAFAFIGFRFHHLGHLPYVWTVWMPLMLLGALMYAERPSWMRAVGVAAATLMNGLTSLTYFVFATPAMLLTLVVLAGRHQRLRDLRFWGRLAVGLSAAAIVMIPFALPYRAVAEEYGMQRRADEVAPNSAEWRDWLTPNLQNRNYGHLAPESSYSHERTLFPGFAIAVLGILGAVSGLAAGKMRSATMAALLWIAVGAAGARGLNGVMHSFLFEVSSAYRGIRMPVRWAILVYVALALLVAIGMLPLLQARSRAVRVAIATVTGALLLVELRAAPIRYFLVPLDPRPVYEWVREAPISGAVVELPLTQGNAYEYAWRSTVHHKPLVNGVSSFMPPHYEKLVALYDDPAVSDGFLDELERMRCSLVVVHPGALREREPAVREWLRRNVEIGRLLFVRHFDAGARGDWVFALTRVEPGAARWRAAEVADRAGRTPLQNAEGFLAGETWTATAATFAFFDGQPTGTLYGRLELRGWVHAASGVRKVRVHFANGRFERRAELQERSDVRALMPWTAPDAIRGFHLIVDPPPFIDGDTDCQVEVIDANGHSSLMPPLFFTWRPARG